MSEEAKDVKEGKLKSYLQTVRREIFISDVPCNCPFCRKLFMQPIPVNSIVVAEEVAKFEKEVFAIWNEAAKEFPYTWEPLQTDSEFQDPFKAFADALLVWNWYKKWFNSGKL